MSIGMNLLVSLCEHDSGHKEFLRLSPAKDDFKGEAELAVFGFVYDHVIKYGAPPKWATVLSERKAQDWDFAMPGVPAATEPPAYYWDKVTERRVHNGLKALVQDVGNMLNAGNPMEAMVMLETRQQSLRLRELKNRIMNYSTDAADLIKAELLAQAQGNHAGLHFGWAYLDGMTGGLVGGDVVSIIGRPAQGKTWCLLHGALHNWDKQGGRPLIISMEMKNTVVTQRLVAMDTRISLTHIKTGQLDKKKQLQPMMKKLKGYAEREPFYVVDGALAVNVPQIKMLIQQLKPTSLWIDGAYLLRHENQRLGRWEKVTDNAERIKGELAEGFGIPAVISYQFNREATKKKVGGGAPGVEDIAYTDAIGQLSSLVLGMMQEESVETMRKRTIQILKGRSGEIGSFDINWSFNHPNAMDFSQWIEPAISELSYM